MVLDNLLNVGLDRWSDVTSSNLGEKSGLCGGQMGTEFSFPFCDLVNGDRIQLYGLSVRNKDEKED